MKVWLEFAKSFTESREVDVDFPLYLHMSYVGEYDGSNTYMRIEQSGKIVSYTSRFGDHAGLARLEAEVKTIDLRTELPYYLGKDFDRSTAIAYADAKSAFLDAIRLEPAA